MGRSENKFDHEQELRMKENALFEAEALQKFKHNLPTLSRI